MNEPIISPWLIYWAGRIEFIQVICCVVGFVVTAFAVVAAMAVLTDDYEHDESVNACSMLYGACVRVAKAMGYKKVITYTLESENGASLKASNFKNDGIAGGVMWTGKRSGRDKGVPKELKRRWVYSLE